MFINHQYHRNYANIPMNVFAIVNVVTMQRRRCYANIPMDEFRNINALMVQLGTSCVFDSPWLPNDSAGYPGLGCVVWGTTP